MWTSYDPGSDDYNLDSSAKVMEKCFRQMFKAFQHVRISLRTFISGESRIADPSAEPPGKASKVRLPGTRTADAQRRELTVLAECGFDSEHSERILASVWDLPVVPNEANWSKHKTFAKVFVRSLANPLQPL